MCGSRRSGTATHFVHLWPYSNNKNNNNIHDDDLENGQALGDVGELHAALQNNVTAR